MIGRSIPAALSILLFRLLLFSGEIYICASVQWSLYRCLLYIVKLFILGHMLSIYCLLKSLQRKSPVTSRNRYPCLEHCRAPTRIFSTMYAAPRRDRNLEKAAQIMPSILGFHICKRSWKASPRYPGAYVPLGCQRMIFGNPVWRSYA